LIDMKLLLAIAYVSLALGAIQLHAAGLETISGRAMGTSYTLKIASPIDKAAREVIATIVRDELERLESIFSLYRADSELNQRCVRSDNSSADGSVAA
jgi:thiamine biosynthesis lipoprotein ApbE